MAFEIILYTNSAEPERVNKTAYLSNPISFIGTLREGTNLLQPSFLINMAGVPSSNYAYIAEFSRYYYITDIVAESTNLWRFNMSCDVLMSFKEQIWANSGIVGRQELIYNPELKDNEYGFEPGKAFSYLSYSKSSTPIGYSSTNFNPYSYLIITANGGGESDLPILRPTPYDATNGYYVLQYAQLKALLQAVWEESVTQGEQFLFDNLGEAIVAVKAFPFDFREISGGSNLLEEVTSVKIGNITLNLPALHIKPGFSTVYDIGSITIPRVFNDFRDYSPYTEVSIYLPMVGYVELDSNEVIGVTIDIQYVVDVDTGKCVVNLLRRIDGVRRVINRYSGVMGATIPISNNGADLRDAQNYMNITSTLLHGGLSLVSSPRPDITGIVTGFASAGIDAALNRSRTVRSGGTASAFADMYGVLDPYAIITRAVASVPTDYAHYYGRPCMETLQIGSLSGFTKMSSVHLENMAPATLPEAQEIETRLKEGVIL